ncbi:MAG: hypothetical protein IKO72_12380 [Kiritimatiellae bacterium]|nr:hypothetical protein [Kiritimatiellia bacterium]
METRDPHKDYFVEWQHATRKYAEARKRINALVASGMGGGGVPILVRQMFIQTIAFISAAIAHFRRCLSEECNPESHRADVLRRQIETAQNYKRMFEWFQADSQERIGGVCNDSGHSK